MEQEEKDKFSKNLTELFMQNESDFFWCPHGVSINFYIYLFIKFNFYI
jgi:hypothetical protein